MEGVMQDSDDVCHVGNEIRLAGNEGLYLSNDGLISRLFVGFEFSQFVQDDTGFQFSVEVNVGIGVKGGILSVTRFFGGFIFVEASLPHRGLGE